MKMLGEKNRKKERIILSNQSAISPSVQNDSDALTTLKVACCDFGGAEVKRERRRDVSDFAVFYDFDRASK